MRVLVILINKRLPQNMQRLEVSDGISLHILRSCDFGQEDRNQEALLSSRLQRHDMFSWQCSRGSVLDQGFCCSRYMPGVWVRMIGVFVQR
jgi:hypothetical protein